jgi:hypothetical protein
MSATTDKLSADVTVDLAAVVAENAALQTQIADLQQQIVTLQGQVSTPPTSPFCKITVTESPTPHANLEFFDGQVVEKDVPAGISLNFTVNAP